MKSLVVVLFVIGLSFFGFQMRRLAPSNEGHAGGTQQMDVRGFVRQTFIEGVPYQEASKYGSDAVPILLRMLSDPGEKAYWPNIVGVLGMVGDERAVGPLITFLSADVQGVLSHPHYKAKSSVPMVLGYLVNKSGNEEALAYLVESLDPDVWVARGLTWNSPYHVSVADRNRHLSTMAIWGLALSGHPVGVGALRSLQEPAEAEAAMRLRAAVSDLVAEALSVHAMIAKVGLAGYYRAAK